MPELPEMETYRRLLIEKVVGKQISSVEVNREKSVNVPVQDFIMLVEGKRMKRIERRAKHLLFYLDNNQVLLLHLMLGGWMFYGTEMDQPKRSHQVILRFGDHALYFIGLRLGYLHIYDMNQLEERLKVLGPEPLSSEFTLPWFKETLGNKRGALKPLLVDQKLIAGIGNCYSDEICFDAAILPIKKVTELDEQNIERIYHSIRSVLNDAVRNGGYMEFPFYTGDRFTGGYDEKCRVYDREGEECVRCGHLIVKDSLSSRKVFYCLNCQH